MFEQELKIVGPYDPILRSPSNILTFEHHTFFQMTSKHMDFFAAAMQVNSTIMKSFCVHQINVKCELFWEVNAKLLLLKTILMSASFTFTPSDHIKDLKG